MDEKTPRGEPGDLQWMTTTGVAAYWSVDERTVARWADEGRLTRYRVGRRTVRYSRDQVESLARPQT